MKYDVRKKHPPKTKIKTDNNIEVLVVGPFFRVYLVLVLIVILILSMSIRLILVLAKKKKSKAKCRSNSFYRLSIR